jgi:hypothetical protein
VIARARFFLSEQFFGNVEHLRSGALSVDELLTMMIFGLPAKAPSLNDIYQMNAAAWLGARVHVVRFEDMVRHLGDLESDQSEQFFTGLLEACGIERPDDWRERVTIGADKKQSGTARQNLTGIIKELPAKLGSRHRALVDYQAPGLRALLGYQ